MKKIFTLALLALVAVGASADTKKDAAQSNKPVFTTIKANPITSIKNQNRSGTCWDYSTLSFFEAEILKATGKTYDLCESFVANKDYMDRAVQVVRLHGDCQFAQGGSAYDVLYVLKNYGICPDNAMPFPGSLTGDSLYNFNEFFSMLEPYVAAISKNKAKKISGQWKVGLQGILDAYLGKCPEKFTYNGKEYTPKSFAASLGLNFNDYVSITSFSHKPYYTQYPVEVQDNWRNPLSWNLPVEDMARIIENAVKTGYTVAWVATLAKKASHATVWLTSTTTRLWRAWLVATWLIGLSCLRASVSASSTHSVARFLNLLLQQSSASSVSTTGNLQTTTVCLSTVSQRTSMARNTIW